MRTDAVAPVIAVMLILAIAVTFYSAWNALVIPSMKQTAEVEHLRNVESAFRHFSSDITYAASSHQNHLSFSEPVELGGGDVILDTVRSAGGLSVGEDSLSVYNLILYNISPDNQNEIEKARVDGTIINIAYEPVGNFWQDQGYRYQEGYINVTKYNRALQTPLGYYNMTDVTNDMSDPRGTIATFAQSFGEVSYRNTTPDYCSNLTLLAVNITVSPDHRFVSSNGFGMLKLVSNVTKITLNNDIQIVSIGSGQDNQDFFGRAAFNSWKNGLDEAASVCKDNIYLDPSYSPDENPSRYLLKPKEPDQSSPTVTIENVAIEVSAY